MSDQLQKFLFKNADIRGSFVELSKAWHAVLQHHSYPLPVIKLLGEMTAAVTLLSGSIKFNGATVMQIHGSGPIQLLVVECNNTMQIRATAKLNAQIPLTDISNPIDLINADGKGRCIITLDPHEKIPGQRPYQGIVSLEGKTVSEIIENYMKHSEQVDTRIWLAANKETVKGLLLQKMPPKRNGWGVVIKNEDDDHQWEHLTALASTLKSDEMLSTDISTLQHRLFWEENITNFSPLYPTFHCGCSREKVSNMLKMLGKNEVNQSLQEQGTLKINCDYCGKTYSFNQTDCDALFVPSKDAPEKQQ